MPSLPMCLWQLGSLVALVIVIAANVLLLIFEFRFFFVGFDLVL